MRPLVLTRPEPGLSQSAARARSMGLTIIEWPLFRIEAVAWAVPAADKYDAILLSSANAIRAAGSGLSQLLTLPVYAVGQATADVARDAGLTVIATGDGGIDRLIADIPQDARLLHLVGKDRVVPQFKREMESLTVYRSVADPSPPPADLSGAVIAVHSPRAGARLSELVGKRDGISIAAISMAAAAACGGGWMEMVAADNPTDSQLLSLAATLCQTGAQ
nr:uroporphyrinogen-III synthase [uncultured Sphingomonas sp.]